MSTWAVTKQFRLLAGGEFSREAESHLTKNSVRSITELGHYVYTAKVEAESASQAGIAADRQLLELIGPYGVSGHVYASQVVEVAGQ